MDWTFTRSESESSQPFRYDSELPRLIKTRNDSANAHAKSEQIRLHLDWATAELRVIQKTS